MGSSFAHVLMMTYRLVCTQDAVTSATQRTVMWQVVASTTFFDTAGFPSTVSDSFREDVSEATHPELHDCR